MKQLKGKLKFQQKLSFFLSFLLTVDKALSNKSFPIFHWLGVRLRKINCLPSRKVFHVIWKERKKEDSLCSNVIVNKKAFEIIIKFASSQSWYVLANVIKRSISHKKQFKSCLLYVVFLINWFFDRSGNGITITLEKETVSVFN